MMNFGLMFFASSEDALTGNRYRVVTESARFADSHGFSSVWVPERHFTKFGSLYPNPAVLHSALAMVTSRIRLNAGSIVVPLHNPLRIAEEWAMVDNLSGGRVGISLASGWNPADFAFFPERYQNRQEILLSGAHAIRKLWSGETTTVQSGNGEQVSVRIYPSPVQEELPMWLTAAGNPQTYVLAGELGANLLTHLLDQNEDQLASKIALYRKARAEHGFDPDSGIVTVMLHAYVGADGEVVREQARKPFCQYIKSNIGLLKGLSQSRGQNVDISSMPEQDLDDFVNFLYERFAAERGLIGTPESCLPLVERLRSIGTNEIACLLDFGPDVELILSNLPHLSRLKDLCQTRLAIVKESASLAPEQQKFSVDNVKARCPAELSGAEFNDQLLSYGIEIDGGFKAIERIWRRDGEALGRIRVAPEFAKSATAFTIHPAFLDACSRILAAALPEDAGDELYLPAGIRSLNVVGTVPVDGWSHATTNRLAQNGGPQSFEGDVDIYDLDGHLVVQILGLRLERPLHDNGALQHRFAEPDELAWRRNWIARPPAEPQNIPQGKWMILGDRSGVGASLSALLEEAGADCIFVSPHDHDWASREAMRAMIARESPQHILHLSSLDATAPEETSHESLRRDQEFICGSALHMVQAVCNEAVGNTTRLYFVTKGAMALQDGEAVAVAQAPLWGLARAMSVEHTRLWGGIVDLDRESSPSVDGRRLLEWLRQTDGEDMVAFRGSTRHVARLQRGESVKLPAEGLHFDNAATYLIAGGPGGLGLEVARWMMRLGASNLALVSRSEPGAKAKQTIGQLEKNKVRVRVFQADISRIDELSPVISEIESTMPPLKGVFHLAGVLDDAMLTEQTWQRFHNAGLAKIEGAWNLHELTEVHELEFFVLFSSMASLVTMPGQANYAAANSFLDALAHYRNSLGKPALSVNWGPWGEIGHAATQYGRKAHLELAKLGIDPIAPRLGLQLLETFLAQRQTQVGVAHVNWSKLFQADPAAALSPLLSEQVRHATMPVAAASETEFLKLLRALPEVERRDALITLLSELISKALKLKDNEGPSAKQGLFALGLDSILALQLKSQLELRLGRSFRATLFFTYPTIESLTEYLLSELRMGGPTIRPTALSAESQGLVTESFGELSALEALSEEEMARLIVQEIDGGREVIGAASRSFDQPGNS